MYASVRESKGECRLCPRGCRFREGSVGACRARAMVGGRIVSQNYGAVTSISIDPIEKKPLYHFMPGSGILSIGTYGCNLACEYCQNWEISQRAARSKQFTPEELTELALSVGEQSVGVAYTYSEPTVWYEFVYDCAALVHEAGLLNVLVTNGEINPDPLAELIPLIDAVNIDLKAFTEEYYRTVCGGSLKPVLDTIRCWHEAGCHVELTTLVAPGLNDSEQEMSELSSWVAELSPEIPLHISRYYPNYRMTAAATPVETLERCAKAARERLNYVYIGNADVLGGNDTVCPDCGELLIERRGYSHVVVHLAEAACPRCGRGIPVRLDSAACAHNQT
ncbi:MAG: AmmeMemoRadiSam system radical SAM enzyme [Clostridia bacterium]|nr:AmmeMemoRadiSam system radical SAM enzyme [Clostridia bacterium]